MAIGQGTYCRYEISELLENPKASELLRRHRRVFRRSDGRLVSVYAPGARVERGCHRRALDNVKQRCFIEGIRAVENIVGASAMRALVAAAKRGDKGLVALLHTCAGACVGVQDYEKAMAFRDQAAEERDND